MPDNTKKSNQERIKQITESIEIGIRELFESDRFKSYLSTMSRFHRYSVNNTVLIYMQRPDATHVAGFNAWKDKFGRHVKKGEKGIQILAPTSSLKKIKEAVLDPDTKAPVLDDEGNVKMEEKSVRTATYFRPVSVFDVSQTEGKPLPKLAQTLTGNVAEYDAFVEALRRSAPVPIEFEQMSVTTDGYFSAANQRIAIRPGMSQVQTVAAMVHEIGHSRLHDYEKLKAAALTEGGKEPPKKDRNTEEVEAESIAYAVCQYYGIETAENSFGYIASWSKDKELKELRASLDTISRTVSALVTDVDRNLSEIRRERGLEQKQEADAPEQASPEKTPAAEIIPTGGYAQDAVAEIIVEEPASAPEAAQGDDPYLTYASAVCDHAEELFTAGLIENPFAIFDKPELANVYAELLRTEGPRNGLEVLADFAGRSGYPTPEHLKSQLSAISNLWDKALTYQIGTSLDPNVSFISSYRPDGKVNEGILFQGPTDICEKLLSELRDGNVTAAQAREMNRQWNKGALPPGPPEALYLVEDAEYYHVQATDAGFDYSVYDAASGKLNAGGRFSLEAAQRHISAETLIQAALIEAMIEQGRDQATFVESPPERLQQLQEANELPTEPVKLDEYPMPDSTVEPDALKVAGCADSNLVPVSRDRALELLADGFTIYAVNTQSLQALMCLDETDISDEPGLLFSLDRTEWEKSPEYRAVIREYRMDHQAEREAAFLRYPGDAFAIYQLNKEGPQWRDRSFMDLAYIREKGMEPTREHYDLIYTGAEEKHPTVKAPEDAFRVFNLERPADFGGHSLSVSDIVAFKHNGVVTYHYCDSVGFEEIPDFQKPENYLKNAEMAMEDDYGMIDGIINNGPREQTPPQSGQDREPTPPERPSLLEQLKTRRDQENQDQPKEKTERIQREERSI